ncbi:MAG: cysteine synthase A [Oscillospiraceae bacterium]|nr:cysteine synthase A [Oscillospiraceae bacterium]
MKILTSAEQLIGNTHLMELTHIKSPARILAKLEFLNPGGSVKDRVARSMLDEAEREGKLRKGSVIIEPTSGNTGIGLALLATLRGYRAMIIMLDTMSVERVKLMEAYGAEVRLVPGGMTGAIREAERLLEEIPGAIIAGQFQNPANPKAHYDTTGPEIWDAAGESIDIFTCGVGTGGTITGTGRYLKERKSDLTVVGIEPTASAVLSAQSPGPHGIQGIGAGFVPEVLDAELLDEVLRVTDEQAFAAARLLAQKEGLFVGISSGAALCGALLLANRPENAGKTIVTILPDSGSRYLSVEGFV